MTPKQIVQFYEDGRDEEVSLSDFKKITDKLHPSQDLCGMLKLASLMKHPEKFEFGAEHDEMFFYVRSEDLSKNTTEDDLLYLAKCGITLIDDAFHLFV